MPSILETLFRSTCAVKRSVTGSDDVVTINGKDYEDALVEILTASEVFVAGGKAESGGFKCQLPIADFDSEPKRFDDIKALGQSLKILSVDNVNGVVYIITAGDPLSES
jgi:hypothetical protein